MRLIDSEALIDRLRINSPDPEGVDEWIRIINNEPCAIEQIKNEVNHMDTLVSKYEVLDVLDKFT